MIIVPKKEITLETNKEWILTNGLGGYSSSTIINLNTRKYHGLLIASFDYPIRRNLVLSKVEETVIFNKEAYNLGVNQYPGKINPEGYKYLDSFVFNNFPTFNYKIKNLEISKSILMLKNSNSVLIRYYINSREPFMLKVRPFVNLRDIHKTDTETKDKFRQKENKTSIIIETNDIRDANISIIMGCDKGMYKKEEFWIYNNEYREEKERGYDFRENHFSPGEFLFKGKKGISFFNILCVADKKEKAYSDFERFYSSDNNCYKKLFESENSRINYLTKQVYGFNNIGNDWLLYNLIQSADNFIVNKNNLKSVIAGYPWFSEYYRDALISLPGLCLVTGRIDDAKQILLNIKNLIKNGLVPLQTTEYGNVEYNSIDTSLWFIYAIYKFHEYTNNIYFIKENLWGEMKTIINAYKLGTEFRIKMDGDGLLKGDYRTSLTWMDTQYTIRKGKNVEVNALWYNCLKIMEYFANQMHEDGLNYYTLSKKVKKSFIKEFWLGNYLADTVDGYIKDVSVRPNQIFALSLPFRILDTKKELIVLKKVTEELFTPFGLRSLSPKDYKYIGKYSGSQFERDKAYHNGTVWGWLIGSYVSAYLRLHNYSSLSKNEIKEKLLRQVVLSFNEYGIETIPEIYDGDYPYSPRGCISQAWSVAEILRAYVEDVMKK